MLQPLRPVLPPRVRVPADERSSNALFSWRNKVAHGRLVPFCGGVPQAMFHVLERLLGERGASDPGRSCAVGWLPSIT